jgi:hypothetical protein
MAGSHGHGADDHGQPRHKDFEGGIASAGAGPADDPLSLRGSGWVLPVALLCVVLALLFSLVRGLGDVIPAREKHAQAAAPVIRDGGSHLV